VLRVGRWRCPLEKTLEHSTKRAIGLTAKAAATHVTAETTAHTTTEATHHTARKALFAQEHLPRFQPLEHVLFHSLESLIGLFLSDAAIGNGLLHSFNSRSHHDLHQVGELDAFIFGNIRNGLAFRQRRAQFGSCHSQLFGDSGRHLDALGVDGGAP